MKKAWLPNWEAVEQYPNFSQINKKELAWEFLRRNPAYQKDYADYKKLDDDGYIEKFLSHRTIKIQGENVIITEVKKEGEQKSFSGLRDAWSYLMNKYGLVSIGFPNPELKYDEHILLTFENNSFHYLEYLEGIPQDQIAGLKPSRPCEIAVLFDLELPIDNLLKKVSSFIKEKQKILKEQKKIEVINKRDRSGILYINYLRVLDAFSQGEELSTIAENIFPGENICPDYLGNKKINNYHKAAIKIRDHDYRYLIHMES